MSCAEIKPDETQKPSGQEYLALKFTMLKFEAKCHRRQIVTVTIADVNQTLEGILNVIVAIGTL